MALLSKMRHQRRNVKICVEFTTATTLILCSWQTLNSSQCCEANDQAYLHESKYKILSVKQTKRKEFNGPKNKFWDFLENNKTVILRTWRWFCQISNRMFVYKTLNCCNHTHLSIIWLIIQIFWSLGIFFSRHQKDWVLLK